MSTTQDHPVDEFMRGVEHGRTVSAMDVIALRLDLEGQARKRVRVAVAAERRRQRLRTRRRVIAAIILTGIAVYNAQLHGLSWPA